MRNIAFPYSFDSRGRTAEAPRGAHVRDMIEQLLFTSPGERVNRPDFGSGVFQLLFAPNSVEVAATTQALVQSALQQWLGDIIQVDSVVVESVDSTLQVTVVFIDRRDQQQQIEQFRRGGTLP